MDVELDDFGQSIIASLPVATRRYVEPLSTRPIRRDSKLTLARRRLVFDQTPRRRILVVPQDIKVPLPSFAAEHLPFYHVEPNWMWKYFQFQ